MLDSHSQLVRYRFGSQIMSECYTFRRRFAKLLGIELPLPFPYPT